MAEPVSALGGRVAEGAVTIRDRGLVGMVTLRGDHGLLRGPAEEAAGVAFPDRNRVNLAGDRGLFWMSPDEALLMLPYAEAGAAVARIGAALEARHHLAVNVSDARAVIGIEGPGAREVLAKVAPVDLHPLAFGPGDFRRTRVGQVAGAFWCEDEGRFGLICFRSVADYVFALLAQSARDGAVGAFPRGG